MLQKAEAAVTRFYLRWQEFITIIGITPFHYSFPHIGFIVMAGLYALKHNAGRKREKEFRTAREERFNYGITHKSIMHHMDRLDDSMAFAGMSRLAWTAKGYYVRNGKRYTITVESSALIDQSDREATELIA